MRVTSNTYPTLLIATSQNLQSREAQLQSEISSGNSIQSASDNPIAYGQAVRSQTILAQNNAYTQTVTQATTTTSANNHAMSSLHQIVAQVANLATGINTTQSTADLQSIGTQVNSLVTQLVNIVNSKDNNNNYLFGGTSNQPPISAATQTYNSSTNSSGQSLEISQGNTLQVGILAGRPGTPAVNGFLYDSGSGVDVLAALKNFSANLSSGNTSAIQSTDIQALNAAVDHLSVAVGSTAADMANVSATGQLLTQQSLAQTQQVNSLTQVDLPTALLQIQQTQQNYQAALQAGVRTMNLSILNYLT